MEGNVFRTVASSKLWGIATQQACGGSGHLWNSQKKKKKSPTDDRPKKTSWKMVYGTKPRDGVTGFVCSESLPCFPEIRMAEQMAAVLEDLAEKNQHGMKVHWVKTEIWNRDGPFPQVPKGHSLAVQLANPLTSSVAPGKAPLFLGPQFTVMTKSDSRDSCDPWTLDGFFFRARKPTRVTKTYFSPSKLRTFPDIHVCLSEWGWHRILKRGLNA